MLTRSTLPMDRAQSPSTRSAGWWLLGSPRCFVTRAREYLGAPSFSGRSVRDREWPSSSWMIIATVSLHRKILTETWQIRIKALSASRPSLRMCRRGLIRCSWVAPQLSLSWLLQHSRSCHSPTFRHNKANCSVSDDNPGMIQGRDLILTGVFDCFRALAGCLRPLCQAAWAGP